MRNFLKAKLILLIFGGINLTRKEYNIAFKAQKDKGLLKYGHTLTECCYDAFDWSLMALEEIIDFLQYVDKKHKK